MGTNAASRRTFLALALAGALVCCFPGVARAESGAEIYRARCATCHEGHTPRDVREALAGQPPSLAYAGSKFRGAWLRDWIGGSGILRPAGTTPAAVVETLDGTDRIPKTGAPRCAANLPAPMVDTVAEYLLARRDPRVGPDQEPDRGDFRAIRAYRVFAQQYACVGCHRFTYRNRELGGYSGPTLIGAGKRLNSAWVAAFLVDPKAWVPIGGHPAYALSPRKIDLLTRFIADM